MKRRPMLFVVLATAAVLVAGAILLPPGVSAATSAAPASSTVGVDGATTFAVIGDYGTDNANEAAVASLVKSWEPAYIIAVGDDYYAAAGGTGTDKYDESTGAYYGGWLKDITTTGTRFPVGGAGVNAFFPCLGNHDYSDATPALSTYLTYFTLPGVGFRNSSGNERYYDFVEGAVHFFVLDSCPQEPNGTSSTSVQARWLKAALAASTSAWNIVYDHHPPYSSDSTHGSTTYMQWPFAAWGADVVISGHAHDYERIMRNGIVYFVNGLGGAGKYTFGTPVSGSAVRYSAGWGAQRVTVTGTSLQFSFYSVDGALQDSYTVALEKPAAPTGLVATARSSSRIDLTWTDASHNEAGFRIKRWNGTEWRTTATVGPGVHTCSLTGLGPDHAYSYQVVAYNAAGESAPSNRAAAKTYAIPMHSADLDGWKPAATSGWSASARILVHNGNHAALPGTVASFTWTAYRSSGTVLSSGKVSGTTGSSGTCTISVKGLSTSAVKVIFKVTALQKTGYAYKPTANHDVDGGTNGTTVTVRK